MEVIHLGHDRSVEDIVDCAIQEDAQAIAITSYQGGHIEFFKYMHDLLKERGAGHIKIFGGGGGVILPEEMEELHRYGIARIYSPDDGRAMGLQGMINDVVEKSDFPAGASLDGDFAKLRDKDAVSIARLISAAENFPEKCKEDLARIRKAAGAARTPVLGVTGPGGAGKSSVIDEIVRRFLVDFADKTIAIVSVDPSRRKTGGALLGDRIRMNAVGSKRVYMRSLATRQSNLALSAHVKDAVDVLKAAGYDVIIVETSGIGQSDAEIIEHADLSLYVMTPEYGAATQLEKIQMLDYADMIALNKFDKRGAADALRDVRKQYKRNHELWEAKDEDLPVFGTIASQFNDPGMNQLYAAICRRLVREDRRGSEFQFPRDRRDVGEGLHHPAAPDEVSLRDRREQPELRQVGPGAGRGRAEALRSAKSIEVVEESGRPGQGPRSSRVSRRDTPSSRGVSTPRTRSSYTTGTRSRKKYKQKTFKFNVRDNELSVETHAESLAHTMVPQGGAPAIRGVGRSLAVAPPGKRPRASSRTRRGSSRSSARARIRRGCSPGEGPPERTNRRFHYVSLGMPAKRLSTAFDSVTLYGRDPDHRPDIYGKIGNSGVSVCCLDDAKKLYSGFDLADPKTSVSMTINGPAPMMLAFFLNAAIDQQCELYIREHGLVAEVEKKIEEIYREAGRERPRYHGELPEGNDGLGLMLLGVTGDQVLPADVYRKIKARTLSQVSRDRSGGHPQGGPGAEHVHLLDRVRAPHDGRCPGVLRFEQGSQFLLRVDLGLPHRRSGGESDHAARLHAGERVHLRRVLL